MPTASRPPPLPPDSVRCSYCSTDLRGVFTAHWCLTVCCSARVWFQQSEEHPPLCGDACAVEGLGDEDESHAGCEVRP
jgi:hypothetical protein